MLLVGPVHAHRQLVGRCVSEGCVYTILDRAGTPSGVVRVLYAALTQKEVSAEKKLSGRKSYDSGGEVKFVRLRYNRVVEIANVIREGIKNTCVIEIHKKLVASAVHSIKNTYVVQLN
jgi:hypothetical protein